MAKKNQVESKRPGNKTINREEDFKRNYQIVICEGQNIELLRTRIIILRYPTHHGQTNRQMKRGYTLFRIHPLSVVQPGLEPGQTGPESVVLPLHH